MGGRLATTSFNITVLYGLYQVVVLVTQGSCGKSRIEEQHKRKDELSRHAPVSGRDYLKH